MYTFLVALAVCLVLSCLYVFRQDKNLLRILFFAFGVLLGIGLAQLFGLDVVELIRTFIWGPHSAVVKDGTGYSI